MALRFSRGDKLHYAGTTTNNGASSSKMATFSAACRSLVGGILQSIPTGNGQYPYSVNFKLVLM